MPVLSSAELARDPGELAVLSNAEQVLQDPNLLCCVAKWLTPRGRLMFSTLSRACVAGVRAAEFWTTINGTIVEGADARGKASWSYSEAARYGNRLGSVLRQYGQYCVRLQLANCPWLQVTGLEDISRCCNLVHLDVSGCRHYCVDLLGHLVRHCPSLRSLAARGCARICEPGIIQDLFDLPDRLHLNLEHLDMQGLMFSQDSTESSSSPEWGGDLSRAVGRLAADRLVSLRLGWRGETSGDPLLESDLGGVLQLAGRCGTTLRLLDLAGCATRGAASSALMGCLASLSALRALCLSNCQGSFIGPALRVCPTTQLVALNLRGLLTLRDCDLVPLLSANPGLTSLNVGCCDCLTDLTLTALATSNTRLTALDVCYAARMTSQGVRGLWASLPRLAEFGFSGFAGLTDPDIADLITRLPGLRMIGVGGIPRLTDAALRSIASGCPSLETLYAANLPNVTPAGLEALERGPAAASGRLRRVNMSYCTLLQPADLARLRDKYPYTFDGDMLPGGVVRAENEFLAEEGERGARG
ncbi:hypothetical protein PLESTB_000714400 [Pleodorina starrii]|uniref:F-box/LRR-repeat protein 18 LRR domain-containing protein n=1 Tax=Pleodorina starrii TaxID=330485 RepID=A0A9W6B9P8_9CHLO|nr:hypothetical protein PLESTM_000779000 [Pleodorina starrii]GLC48093.1 hypothetical protein PLESTB_000058500 [Pleodorina starrii]GLC53157.1 hypothetical protein PLESTB_000714400 [Pleodorina starrii]GLC68094.1 hypothetical protein PLESTF_000645400 [Pleodorina starrii]